jgi:hypothetical protein
MAEQSPKKCHLTTTPVPKITNRTERFSSVLFSFFVYGQAASSAINASSVHLFLRGKKCSSTSGCSVPDSRVQQLPDEKTRISGGGTRTATLRSATIAKHVLKTVHYVVMPYAQEKCYYGNIDFWVYLFSREISSINFDNL